MNRRGTLNTLEYTCTWWNRLILSWDETWYSVNVQGIFLNATFKIKGVWKTGMPRCKLGEDHLQLAEPQISQILTTLDYSIFIFCFCIVYINKLDLEFDRHFAMRWFLMIGSKIYLLIMLILACVQVPANCVYWERIH